MRRPSLVTTAIWAAAAALGFPVVAKVSSSVIVHKSDVGGVRVGIELPSIRRWSWGQTKDTSTHPEL